MREKNDRISHKLRFLPHSNQFQNKNAKPKAKEKEAGKKHMIAARKFMIETSKIRRICARKHLGLIDYISASYSGYSTHIILGNEMCIECLFSS